MSRRPTKTACDVGGGGQPTGTVVEAGGTVGGADDAMADPEPNPEVVPKMTKTRAARARRSITRAYRPLNWGSRFSMKAFIASAVSLVEKFTVCAAPSSSRASSNVTFMALFSMRFDCATAMGAA